MSATRRTAAFRKFLRLRQNVKKMKEGAFIEVWDDEKEDLVRRWCVVDSSNEYLLLSDAQTAAAPLRPVALWLEDVLDVERGDASAVLQGGSPGTPGAGVSGDDPFSVPFVALHCRDMSVVLFPASFREFEVWFQGLAFLCEARVGTLSANASPRAQRHIWDDGNAPHLRTKRAIKGVLRRVVGLHAERTHAAASPPLADVLVVRPAEIGAMVDMVANLEPGAPACGQQEQGEADLIAALQERMSSLYQRVLMQAALVEELVEENATLRAALPTAPTAPGGEGEGARKRKRGEL